MSVPPVSGNFGLVGSASLSGACRALVSHRGGCRSLQSHPGWIQSSLGPWGAAQGWRVRLASAGRPRAAGWEPDHFGESRAPCQQVLLDAIWARFGREREALDGILLFCHYRHTVLGKVTVARWCWMRKRSAPSVYLADLPSDSVYSGSDCQPTPLPIVNVGLAIVNLSVRPLDVGNRIHAADHLSNILRLEHTQYRVQALVDPAAFVQRDLRLVRHYAHDLGPGKLAPSEAGEWLVIELNDGQMSGLSENDPLVLYQELKLAL